MSATRGLDVLYHAAGVVSYDARPAAARGTPTSWERVMCWRQQRSTAIPG